jgi:hypothetical protein
MYIYIVIFIYLLGVQHVFVGGLKFHHDRLCVVFERGKKELRKERRNFRKEGRKEEGMQFRKERRMKGRDGGRKEGRWLMKEGREVVFRI